jgi:hypothetical protein
MPWNSYRSENHCSGAVEILTYLLWLFSSVVDKIQHMRYPHRFIEEEFRENQRSENRASIMGVK